MGLRRREVLKVLSSSGVATSLVAGEVAAKKSGEIERDVCIVGGGAAGTYAALRLRDMGKSVAIVERSSRLGGHCETYHDPASGAPIDIGVIVFPDNALVRGYFDRFSVPLITANFSGGSNEFVDFRSGQSVAAYDPSGVEVGTALFTYLQILQTRFPFIEQNGFQLPTSGPVLDELVMPFGQWAQLNGLNALLPTFFLFEQGYGPLLSATTLYVLKNMNSSVVGGILQSSFLLAPFGAGALYDAASAELDGDVLLDSDIHKVDRDDKIRVKVHTGHGARTIKCSKLLYTAPPTLPNFAGFDLDFQEFAAFARFKHHHYWTAVVGIDGMPPGVSLVNTAPETPFNLAPLPGIYSIGPSQAPGQFNVKYGSDGHLPDSVVRRNIKRDIERVATASASGLKLKGFGVFKNHSPYSVVAAPQQIRSGFYADLQALQGRNHTYYSGAAFQTHNSAAIWAHLEELLPAIVS
jgi:hypothetical protein